MPVRSASQMLKAQITIAIATMQKKAVAAIAPHSFGLRFFCLPDTRRGVDVDDSTSNALPEGLGAGIEVGVRGCAAGRVDTW